MLNNELNIDNYLDQVLKSEPEYSLPEDFARKVSVKARKRMETVQMVKDFLIYIGTFVIFAAILLGFGYFFKLEFYLKIKNLLPGNIEWVAGILIVGLFILFVDKVVLPYFFLSRTLKK